MAVTTMLRCRVSWQNFPGAPGVSNFYLDGNDITGLGTHLTALRTFWNSLAALIPTGTTLTVPNNGDLIDVVTGHLVGSWSDSVTLATVTGTGAGSYAGNAGMVVHWLTNGVVNGRRVRGRTFVVPTVSTVFGTNGNPTAANITTLTNAGNTLVTAMESKLVMWARPFTHPTDASKNRTGSAHVVTGTRVPTLPISLRSRRI